MRLALGLGLAFALAIGCGGGGRRVVSGGAGAGAAGQGGSSGAGQGGFGNAAVDEFPTTCVDGVVTTAIPGAAPVVSSCPFGCKISQAIGFSSEAFCNDAPPDAGAGGQGGNPACSPGTDNVVTSCSNGVVTVSTACPPNTAMVGTCPYGCRSPGAFGYAGLGLCNTEPPDAGCDGLCSDASGDASDGS